MADRGCPETGIGVARAEVKLNARARGARQDGYQYRTAKVAEYNPAVGIRRVRVAVSEEPSGTARREALKEAVLGRAQKLSVAKETTRVGRVFPDQGAHARGGYDGDQDRGRAQRHAGGRSP